jgi:hypothetical protein
MNAPFEGIRIQDAISIVNIKDGTINNTVASTGNSIRIGSGTAAGPVAVLIRDIIASASLSARPFSHVVIANAGDVTLVACQLIGRNTNINILPGSGQAVVSVHMIGGFADSPGAAAVIINPSGTGFVGRSSFDGAWLSQAASGSNVVISPHDTATVDGISFVDCEAYGAASGSGYAITQAAGTTVKNISIIGGRIAGNAAGISINGLTSGMISGVVIGASGGFGLNGTGIFLAGAVGRITINNNDLTGSTTKISNSMISSLSRIESNLGYNPVGNVTLTVGASPWLYTASPQRETVYVFGGTISDISINGLRLFGSAGMPLVIPLEPNDTMVITYSVVPLVVNTQRH